MFQGALKINDFSEMGANSRYGVPAWYIFQFKDVKDKSRRVLVE